MLTIEEFAKAAAAGGKLTAHQAFTAIREARTIDDEFFRTLFLVAALNGGQIDWRGAPDLVCGVLERAFAGSFPGATDVKASWSYNRYGYRVSWRGGPLTDHAEQRFGFLRHAVGFFLCESFGISMGKPEKWRSVELVDGHGASPLWISFGNLDEIWEKTERMVREINELYRETPL